MSDVLFSPVLTASSDLYVGGLNWSREHGLQQAVIGLSKDEACVLGAAGRLDRLAAAGGQKGRATILPPVGEGAPRLLLSGTASTVQAMKDEWVQMLGKDGRSVPLHPYDLKALRKPSRKLGIFEAESGCRMVLEDQQKLRLADAVATPRRTCVRLFGDQASQARALGLLAPHLKHSDTPLKDRTLTSDYAAACEQWLSWKNGGEVESHQPLEAYFRREPDMVGGLPIHLPHNNVSTGGPCGFYSFDPELLGAGLELPYVPSNLHSGNSYTQVRQRSVNLAQDKAPLQNLVAVGKGILHPFMLGNFFAVKVLKMDKSRKSVGGVKIGVPRGGTRIGVTTKQPETPAPPTLLNKPSESYVLGRGFVRGPDGKTSRCEAADLDTLVAEGDEVGLLVTKADGAVVVYHRPDQDSEWKCLVHWDAKVTDHKLCFALFELSGAILDIELLHGRPAPTSIGRDIDTVREPKKVWP